MKIKVRLIGVDLDGTLLTEQKIYKERPSAGSRSGYYCFACNRQAV